MPEVEEERPPSEAVVWSLAWKQIAQGRGALASNRPEQNAARRAEKEHDPIARLLALLWHEDPSVRKAAALALCGGDRENAYTPSYGYFASALLREVGEAPERQTAIARWEAVTQALRVLLERSASEIRAMSNMNYSFLSSALYLALLATCLDTIEASRRLRAASTHPELCGLLRSLANKEVTRRLNGQDNGLLAQSAGKALAALSPDEMPEFWHSLTHHPLPHRQALAPALGYMGDHRAVPHLTHALNGQPFVIAEPIVQCLGRLGDLRALPALATLTRGRHRHLRQLARVAITAIERANVGSAARTLLRPARETTPDPAELVRSVENPTETEPPEELLRTFPG